MILVSELLPQKSRDSALPVYRDFVLEIGFMKQHIDIENKVGDLFNLFCIHIYFIHYVKLLQCTVLHIISLWYTVPDCKTLQSTKKCSAVQCSAVQFSAVQHSGI